MRLTLGAIVRWESLCGRSFYSFDFGSGEDLRALLYCVLRPSVCFSSWSGGFDAEEYAGLSEAVLLWSQYIPRSDEGNGSAEPAEGSDAVFVGDVVADLIVSGGVSASWAYEEMGFLELDALQRALVRKQRYDLEDRRLWTFLGMLPHLGGNSVKRPEDLYPFPWEGVSRGNSRGFSDEDLEARLEALEREYSGE